MMRRIEIESADNGYMVTVYPAQEKSKAGEMSEYKEPEKLVARDDEEVLEIVKANL